MRIVLDLDDTLYLEIDYVRSGFHAVDCWLKSNRYDYNFFEEAWSLFICGERKTIFNVVLNRMGLFEENLLSKLVSVYREHTPSIILQNDARKFLFNNNKDDLALITDGPSISQWSKIKALDIEKFVGRIVVTDDIGTTYSKPNTRAFEIVQGNLPGNACIYIADNPLKDFIAPNVLGWLPSIRIRREGALHKDVPTPAGCIEVQSFNGISEFIA